MYFCLFQVRHATDTVLFVTLKRYILNAVIISNVRNWLITFLGFDLYVSRTIKDSHVPQKDNRSHSILLKPIIINQ